MRKLRESIHSKRRGMLTRGMWLLHDNATAHKSQVAQRAIQECHFEQLDHPPYSPGLAPSDYYLFRHLKKQLLGTRFFDDDEVTINTEAWYGSQSEDFYFQGTDKFTRSSH